MRRRYVAFGLIGLVATGAAVKGAAQWTRPAAPDVAIIQSAYAAAEASAAAGRHIDDLVIENAECNPLGAHEFMCQVSYTRRLEPSGRLYFDVVTMTEERARWQLTAGLCRGQARI
jgi:hypothetical protein